jgi:hypothetical protein
LVETRYTLTSFIGWVQLHDTPAHVDMLCAILLNRFFMVT